MPLKNVRAGKNKKKYIKKSNFKKLTLSTKANIDKNGTLLPSLSSIPRIYKRQTRAEWEIEGIMKDNNNMREINLK